MNEIMNAIATVGFPIVACGALFWANYKQDVRHSEECQGFMKSIEANTDAIRELITYLKGGE